MGLIMPDGQPAGTPMGLQIAAPLNDVQLVALMAADMVAAGTEVDLAVERSLAIVGLAITRVQRGHLKHAIEAAEEALGRKQ